MSKQSEERLTEKMLIEDGEVIKNGSPAYEAEDELAVQGLFIDDLHRLRILDPSLADQTLRLKTECDSFVQGNVLTKKKGRKMTKLLSSYYAFSRRNKRLQKGGSQDGRSSGN